MACKPRIKIRTTENYDALTELFIRNELEFSEEEPVDTDVLKCWELTHGNGELEAMIGGLALALREEEYIIDGIAIEPIYRKLGLGKVLLDKAVAEVKARGGKRIFLVARAPKFFEKYGFVAVAREDAPNFFECATCPQYNVSCFPEVMRYDIPE